MKGLIDRIVLTPALQLNLKFIKFCDVSARFSHSDDAESLPELVRLWSRVCVSLRHCHNRWIIWSCVSFSTWKENLLNYCTKVFMQKIMNLSPLIYFIFFVILRWRDRDGTRRCGILFFMHSVWFPELYWTETPGFIHIIVEKLQMGKAITVIYDVM